MDKILGYNAATGRNEEFIVVRRRNGDPFEVEDEKGQRHIYRPALEGAPDHVRKALEVLTIPAGKKRQRKGRGRR